jgi:hypothetical protein
VQQLLWIETLLNFFGGLALVVAPLSTIRLLGLPPTPTGFWPRLLGTILLGISFAFFLEGSVPGSRGLGLSGALIINFSALSMMAAMLMLEAGPPSARGRAFMWALIVLLLWLSALEFANL